MSSARAVVFEALETFAVRELPLPVIGSDEMLLEVLACGVDGSELHMFVGHLEWFNHRLPIIFGDEIIGRISEIGENAAASRGLSVGDVVTVEARWGCGHCYPCTHGNYYLCAQNTTNRGYGTISLAEAPGLWGGYASHVFVHKDARVHRVPDGMSVNTALICCSLLANSISWTNTAKFGLGDTVAIVGPGPQGIGCALVAAAKGARVVSIGLERDAERLAFVKKLAPGVKTVAVKPGESVESVVERVHQEVGEVSVVLDAVASPQAKELAFKLVRTLGTVVQAGLAVPPVQEVDWVAVAFKNLTITNPLSHPFTVPEAFALAQTLLERGIDVGDMVSHSFGLDDAELAIRTASYQTDVSPLKVIIDPSL